MKKYCVECGVELHNEELLNNPLLCNECKEIDEADSNIPEYRIRDEFNWNKK